MVGKLLRDLARPQRIPLKLARKAETAWIKANFDHEKYEREQAALFQSIGLDYPESNKILEGIYGKAPGLSETMASCHHHLFAALSCRFEFGTILEIGTHSGTGSVLLSHLFPKARIETIDLPDDHPVFLATYNRGDTERRRAFVEKRNALLATRSNLSFLQMDSAALTRMTGKCYDFIWIDGAHGYPTATIDITNCIRLMGGEGMIACDDVYLEAPSGDDMYRSIASHETIKRFAEAGIVKYRLIYKRTQSPHGHPRRRKYIAVLIDGNREFQSLT